MFDQLCGWFSNSPQPGQYVYEAFKKFNLPSNKEGRLHITLDANNRPIAPNLSIISNTITNTRETKEFIPVVNSINRISSEHK
jgi:hypothetical protein